MSRMPEPLVVSDSELLERVYAGDVAARERLLDRHRSAVAILPKRAPYFFVDASGRAALWWVPEPGRPRLPFRVVWLALRARGDVPADAPEEHEAVWSAYVALTPPQRLAVWHREVEGQSAYEIGRHLGLGEARTFDLLAAATGELVAAVGEEAAGGLRTALAEVVLGPSAGDYLARRPRAARVLAPEVPRTGRVRPLAGSLAALAVVAMVLALVSPVVGPAPDRGPTEAAPVPGGAVFRPIRQSEVPRPAAGGASVPRPSAPSPSVAGADGPGDPGPPQETPPPSTDPGPGTPEPPPAAQQPVDVQVKPAGAHVVVDPVVVDPVVVDVPLPVVPGLG
jgi:hypothetical protein